MTERAKPLVGKVKGGARFPRHSLAAALPWTKKLVSKTHSGPQPQDVIMAGVVESKGTRGEIKISAMRQFELMEGDKAGYSATDIAKKIVHAPAEEVGDFLKIAALKPPLFKRVFDTFHGDKVSISKIRQRFAELNVHPDNADECTQRYSETLEACGLGQRIGDDFEHTAATNPNPNSEETDTVEQEPRDDPSDDEPSHQDDHLEDRGSSAGSSSSNKRNPRAAIQVSVNLDSSLDTDKLQRQLELLKKYGVI